MSQHNSHAHEKVEKNVGLMAVLIAVAVSFGGLAEIIPLMYQAEAIEPLPGVKPYPALEVAGRDIYVREGCYNCHSQMIRTLRFETERYGHYSLAGESVYDRPFQWGSKRTGPDLERAVIHRFPAYPWLANRQVNVKQTISNMRALQRLGDPYSDEEIESAPEVLTGKTELEAVVAYLQGLGRNAPKSIAAAGDAP